MINREYEAQDTGHLDTRTEQFPLYTSHTLYIVQHLQEFVRQSVVTFLRKRKWMLVDIRK